MDILLIVSQSIIIASMLGAYRLIRQVIMRMEFLKKDVDSLSVYDYELNDIKKVMHDTLQEVLEEKRMMLTILQRECGQYYVGQAVPEGWVKYITESIVRHDHLIKRIKNREKMIESIKAK